MQMKKLVILWTSVSEDNFFNMITPFALGSKREEWFRDVIVIIWGGSAQTIAKTPAIKAELGIFVEEGITVKCCQQCADKYGINSDLEKLGVDIVRMSPVFKDYLLEGARVVSV